MNRDLMRQQCIQLWRTGIRPRTLATSGLSMSPLIRDGSTLTFLPPAGDRSIKVGDIALFERAGILVAHRIVGRFYRDGSLWFREKGDNGFTTGTFPASSLIGRIVQVEHNGHIRDLTLLRQRLAGRLAGLYWQGLLTVLRCACAVKHTAGCTAALPRVRTFFIAVLRFLSRLPLGFIRS